MTRARAGLGVAALALALCLPLAGRAQDGPRLADIRRVLDTLRSDIAGLRAELTSGDPAVTTAPAGGSSLLERVDAIEAELRQMVGRTEVLENRLRRVVEDGSRRLGELDFRLTTLEGGDTSTLGRAPRLGDQTSQASQSAVAPALARPPVGMDLAVAERSDFITALEHLEANENAAAAQAFARFDSDYPGSPMAAAAALGRGRALAAMGDMREAARAYLQSYSGDPDSPVAADAVLALGSALGALGKTEEACLTLAQIAGRYPSAAGVVAMAGQERARLGCG